MIILLLINMELESYYIKLKIVMIIPVPFFIQKKHI